MINNRTIGTESSLKSCQIITLNPFSDSIWLSDIPVIEMLEGYLKDETSEVSYLLSYTFNRPGPIGNTEISDTKMQPLTILDKINMLRILNGTANSLDLPGNFVPSILRLPPTGSPLILAYQVHALFKFFIILGY